VDASTTEARGATPLARTVTCIALLWLIGIGLRATILAVPPLIRLIHDDLQMSETEVGILSGLPPVLFAAAAVPGSLLIARLGALPTVITGLFVTAIGSALRGAAPDVVLLYAATVVTGFGVAVMQPAVPPLVRNWLPDRIGFATAVYANGALIGEILPVALMMPLVLPMVGRSWRLGFVVWGAVCAAIALIILALAPRRSAITDTTPRGWWPNWRDGRIWRLGLMFGSVNAMYFSTNTFIPDYLHHGGQPEFIGPALNALNIGQLPASIILLAYTSRLVRRAWPYAASAILCLLSILGILFGSGWTIVFAAGLLGFAGAAIFVFILALPPLLSAPEDIHRMTAGTFTISYSCAVVVPVISGLIWDATAIPAVAFVPIGLCAFVLMALAPGVRQRPR
jgi:CP family cyanate transporter-like MFS transporter